jgi:hypothetical protein
MTVSSRATPSSMSLRCRRQTLVQGRFWRIETRAGHGAGMPLDKIIAQHADMWAFAAYWTGLEVKPVD